MSQYYPPYQPRSWYSVDVNRETISQRTIFKIVFAVILVIVLYFFLWPSIKKRWSSYFGTKVKNVPYKPGGGTVDDSFANGKAESYVKSLNDSFSNDTWYGRNTDNCDVYRRFCNELNDNQLIFVANSYKNTFGETIRKKIVDAGEYTCGFFDTDYRAMLLEKLNALNIP